MEEIGRLNMEKPAKAGEYLFIDLFISFFSPLRT